MPGYRAHNHDLRTLASRRVEPVVDNFRSGCERRNRSRLEDENFPSLSGVDSISGLPPGIWRVIVNQFMEAASLEYRARYGDQRGSAEFDAWRNAFRAWSAINIFKAVVVFLAESKIGVFTLSNAAAVSLRNRLLERLAAKGVQMSAIVGAEQIVKKVTIYLEIAWITGCATYCGALVGSTCAAQFATSAAEAIRTFGQVVGAIANAVIREVVARPILVGRAMLDPANWDTSPLPSAALSLRLVGNSIWTQLDASSADHFLERVGRSLSQFNIPQPVIAEIAAAATSVVQARGGFNAAIVFTPDWLLSQTPLSLVQVFRDYGLLRFVRPPEAIADDALGQ